MIASNQAFIVAAYAVTWLVIVGYLLYLTRASRRVRAGLSRVVGSAVVEEGQ